jgi:hypothetical protein
VAATIAIRIESSEADNFRRVDQPLQDKYGICESLRRIFIAKAIIDPPGATILVVKKIGLSRCRYGY